MLAPIILYVSSIWYLFTPRYSPINSYSLINLADYALVRSQELLLLFIGLLISLSLVKPRCWDTDKVNPQVFVGLYLSALTLMILIQQLMLTTYYWLNQDQRQLPVPLLVFEAKVMDTILVGLTGIIITVAIILELWVVLYKRLAPGRRLIDLA